MRGFATRQEMTEVTVNPKKVPEKILSEKKVVRKRVQKEMDKENVFSDKIKEKKMKNPNSGNIFKTQRSFVDLE